MYTHIAGFIEPGETIENAVKREVWEESGLYVNHVDIVQSQPWPYPVNIMIGCVAIVDDVNLNLDHDLELEDAVWLDINTVKEIVYEGQEDEDLTVFKSGIPYGIPNDKTLATKLFQYVVDTYA
jgi:NAD+ diphosphatase